jgi:hypothetical protein
MRIALLLVAATCAGACADNDESLVIQRFVPADPSMQCSAQTNSMFNQTQGVLDAGLVVKGGTRGYVANAVIANNLPTRILGTSGGIETNAIQVIGLDVELIPTSQIAGALPASQRNFRITAAGGIAMPGMGAVVVPAEIIPAQVAALVAPAITPSLLRPKITARLRPVGTHAGSELVGAPVDFPVEICNFCLTGGMPPQPCPSTGIPMSQILLGNACFPAQDASVTCCTTSTGALLCGSQVPVQKS